MLLCNNEPSRWFLYLDVSLILNMHIPCGIDILNLSILQGVTSSFVWL